MSTKPDRPWQEVIVEKYNQRRTNPLGPLQVKVALSFMRLLDDAAKREDVTRATFIRRACAVQMQRVLGGSIYPILAQCPSSKPHGTSGGRFTAEEFDTGEDIQRWCPHPGCHDDHF